MKLSHIILFWFFQFIILFPQQTSDWKNYTDKKSVRDVISLDGKIWAASTGGGFSYNIQSGEYKNLNKADGMVGLSLNSVAADNSGKIWFGANTGLIDVYNPQTGDMNPIMGIFLDADYTAKGINELNKSGDTIIASTDFGVCLLNPNTLAFYDTYFRFGTFPTKIKVNSVLKKELFYVCTDNGIAIQKPGSVNLSAPESWNNYTTANGLSSNQVLRLAEYQGNIIAGTSKGLSRFNGVSWEMYNDLLSNSFIKDLIVSGDSLYVLYNDTISVLSNNIIARTFKLPANTYSIYSAGEIGLIAATNIGAYVINRNEFYYPNGPQANQFPSLSVDAEGNLWSASGRDVTGVGFYKYSGSTWTNYNTANTPGLPTNSYFFVNTAGSNIYLGSWGSGFTRLNENRLDVFNSSNTSLTGTLGNPNFVVISNIANDSRSNAWLLNYESASKQTLSVLTSDSLWFHYQIPSEQGLALTEHYSLAVDFNGTKWFSNIKDRAGLYFFNENNSFEELADDKSGYITTTNGLNSNYINSIVVDRRGDIWLGTSLGVNIITNPNSALLNNPQFRISSVFALRQQTVNCMLADPLNNKWIGTNQGLLYVNSDGTGLLAAYNTKNSALLSDEIRSLAFDRNSGTLYIGTDAGLISFVTPAVAPQESFTELFVYPSPFKLNTGSNQLTIDGLVRDSDIKILNISGRLVNEFSSPGGKVAFWDGRDIQGDLVNSGIYLIVASDKEGNNVMTAKVAVLRE